MFDLQNNLLPSRALSPAAAITDDTAQVTEIRDTEGFETVMLYIPIGVIDDVNATFAVLIEDGDDSGLSDAAAVADAQLNPTEAIVGFDFADDNTVRRIEVRPAKRYLRATITPSGNSANPTGAFFCALWVMGNPKHAPVTAQAD